jgi:hypothetical protein
MAASRNLPVRARIGHFLLLSLSSAYSLQTRKPIVLETYRNKLMAHDRKTDYNLRPVRPSTRLEQLTVSMRHRVAGGADEHPRYPLGSPSRSPDSSTLDKHPSRRRVYTCYKASRGYIGFFDSSRALKHAPKTIRAMLPCCQSLPSRHVLCGR